MLQKQKKEAAERALGRFFPLSHTFLIPPPLVHHQMHTWRAPDHEPLIRENPESLRGGFWRGVWV